MLQIVATLTGCTLAEADEVRRALGSPRASPRSRRGSARWRCARGYDLGVVEQVWEVLKAFASFGFCKAHAAAFALPTYQSAWLKAHHPAAFLAGVLTHDPGMYPKRLILDDARQFGIAVLPLDVNASDATYRVEKVAAVDEPPPADPRRYRRDRRPTTGLRPTAAATASGSSLADVKGITEAEVARIVAGRPYASLADFWHRAAVSRPVVERLVVAGAFDALYGLGTCHLPARPGPPPRPGHPARPAAAGRRARPVDPGGGPRRPAGTGGRARRRTARHRPDPAAAAGEALTMVERPDVRALAARQSQAARPVEARPGAARARPR